MMDMIEQQQSIFTIKCDVCGKKVGVTFFRYEDALNHARLAGWRLQWGKGYWQNICPECIEMEEK